MTDWTKNGVWMFVAGVICAACVAAVQPPTDAGGEPRAVVVGTFDSRAIAIAYVGSPAFSAKMTELHAELDAARAAGDDARVAELEALGPAMQAELHARGFSTASVDAYLDGVRERIPAVAAAAGVDVIVCKWDVVHAADDAEFVDVTEALVMLFDPDERTLRSTREIVEQEPIPLDELRHDH